MTREGRMRWVCLVCQSLHRHIMFWPAGREDGGLVGRQVGRKAGRQQGGLVLRGGGKAARQGGRKERR